MAVVNNCNLPDDLYYFVEKHVWGKYEDGVLTMGLTDVAQNLAKTIISVTPKKQGKSVEQGKSVATVESGKWVGPVPSLVAGEIVEINQSVVSSPATINSDPYGDGWIVKLSPSNWDTESASLATGEAGLAAYKGFLDAEGITCE